MTGWDVEGGGRSRTRERRPAGRRFAVAGVLVVALAVAPGGARAVSNEGPEDLTEITLEEPRLASRVLQ
jgi:hypothetical protein